MVASNRTLNQENITIVLFLFVEKIEHNPLYLFCLLPLAPGLILRNLGWKYIFGTTIYPLNILINVSFLSLLFQEVLLELNKVYFLLENTIIQLSAVTFSTTVQNCRNLYIT